MRQQQGPLNSAPETSHNEQRQPDNPKSARRCSKVIMALFEQCKPFQIEIPEPLRRWWANSMRTRQLQLWPSRTARPGLTIGARETSSWALELVRHRISLFNAALLRDSLWLLGVMRLSPRSAIKLSERIADYSAKQTHWLRGERFIRIFQGEIDSQDFAKRERTHRVKFITFGKLISRSLLGIPSLWLITAFTTLAVFEIPSASGRLLEGLGAANFAGWLGQLVFLSLFIDSLRGALPRAFALIPILFYSSYYFAYWEQGVQMTLKSKELTRTNPGKVIDFDPRSYSLVMEKADVFAASHSIPVVYAHHESFVGDEYVSYRLMAREKIKKYLSRNYSSVQIFSVYWDDVMQPNVRELEFPERPKHRILSATVRDDPSEGWKDFNIGIETTLLSLDGRVAGAFKSAYVHKLSMIPIFRIGCMPLIGVQKTCKADFITERIPIESRPGSVDRALYDDPVSVMLGIKELSRIEITDFHGFSGEAAPRAAPGEDEAFEALRDVISGQNPALSWATFNLISGDSSRLAPLAAGMAKRFVDLSRMDNADLPGLREQAALLATGIAALGPAEFASIQGELADLARRDDLRDEYPLLYLRLADAGLKSFAIYRDQFLAQSATQKEKLLASLAICRIGQADSELISAIKSEWSESDNDAAKADNYRAALFVALAKLGQETLLRSTARTNSKVLQGWYDAVLAGRGKTEVGPNNCMPLEWPDISVYLPAIMAPRLRWVQGQWRVVD